ncbi:D-allose-binding periplasmic protein precursor [Posidoniimonas polymericola]|uniref:D-allose-binding periplasmic protein n=1 Tax=Posidoniimonas polymericola TaxID=2528002 RepID=A0A5C5ZGM3_9BACT|nr:substrate-binding domain-containing protein [Posidoniimonas polymericola]TWT86021.1 D-allose-binding periplasmic protein precursor [Posidoniimonas polymericola]
MLKQPSFWIGVVIALAVVGWFRMNASEDAEVVREKPSKIAFVTAGEGEFWQAAVAGAEDAAEELGVELDVRMPKQTESVQEQNELLTTLSSGKYDGIAVSPVDAEGQTPVINSLAADRPVVTYDSDSPLSARHGFVGTSNFSAGLRAGTLVKQALPAGGEVLVLMVNRTKSNMQDRRAGFKTRIEESPNPEQEVVDQRYQVVDYLTDEGDDQRCRENIQESLEEHPDLKCIVGMNARHGPILLSVLKEAGKLGQIKLITFDTLPETLQGVRDGSISATIAQDPFKYGNEAVRMLVSLHSGDPQYLPVVGRGAIHVSVEAIDNSNIDEFQKRVEQRIKRSKKPMTAKAL